VERGSLETELCRAADVLNDALLAYNRDNASFPPNAEPLAEAFQRDTLEPLVRRGHLRDASLVTDYLQRGRVTAYDSPDLPTVNGDFWAVLVHAEDPTVQCLLADTDEYPGRIGERLRGTYLIQGTRLKHVSR
jgi:hypothetical protein